MNEHTLRLKLKAAWDTGDLVLFLGAGVSIPYGIPNWADLVVEMLIEHNGSDGVLPPQHRTAVGRWMRENSDFNPLPLSRILKRQDGNSSNRDYFERLRRALYRRRKKPNSADDTLQTIARLIAVSEQQRMRSKDGRGWNVHAVVTTNFDDLLETELTKLRVPFKTHYHADRPRTTNTPNTLPILHVHGFLPNPDVPLDDELLSQTLILAEDDYHRLTQDSSAWANQLKEYMSSYTVLFIGCSMRDPNVRRLLDATKQGKVRHFLFRRNYRIPNGDDLARVVRDIQQRALEADKTAIVDDDVVGAAILNAFPAAKLSDQEIFEQLDVGVLWFDSHRAIALYLDGAFTKRLHP